MDLGTNLIFLVVFGIVGFLISKFWGINPYRIFSDLGTMAIVVPLAFFMIKASLNPEESINMIGDIMTFFVENLPGILIGDIAGSIIGAFTGEHY